MGLPLNRRSLHYRQEDGWVHAVDLRTRGPLRSLLVEWYFRAMGFDTLRHTGTRDHLHVSLSPADQRDRAWGALDDARQGLDKEVLKRAV